jgi:hypothetical protein
MIKMPKAVVTYKENRKALFGLRSNETSMTAIIDLPIVPMRKRFHVQVQTEPNTAWQPVESSHTIEEAVAIIKNEREEDLPANSTTQYDFFAGYTDGLAFRVKDSRGNIIYNYNQTKGVLEEDLM